MVGQVGVALPVEPVGDAHFQRLEHVEDVELGERHLRQRVQPDRLAAEALRTLAVAYRRLPDGHTPPGGPEAEALEHELVYVGVAGIIDPPRAEAGTAIAEAHAAGVRVMMITGDHPVTASRIAADLGIVEPGARTLNGTDVASE